MTHRRIWVFFYGSYINLDVLAEVSMKPGEWQAARLLGFDLHIGPRANLLPNPNGVVHGTLGLCLHDDLARLYDDHAFGVLGERYLPEAVLCVDAQGALRPAVTYVSHDMVNRPATHDYVERIAKPAAALGFPGDYVTHIRSFAP